MALDKQRILNELGSVVNQLQSADCGCMGKLFSNPGNPNCNGNFQNAPVNPAPGGCMGGCHQGHGWGHGCHGYNAPGSGEPFSGNRNCGGFCNPPKLYADTYNYLNHNLMQPVVKEVYDDLKSITPGNTMMNSPVAAQMGLRPAGNTNPMVPGSMGGGMGNTPPNYMSPGMGTANNPSNHHHAPSVRFGNPNMDNNHMGNANGLQQNMRQMAQPMGGVGRNMGGMGADIVNMMLSDSKPRNFPNQGNVQQGGMGNVPPQSTEMNMTPNVNGNQGQYNSGMSGSPGQFNNMMQGSPGGQIQSPNTQYMSQPNMFASAKANIQGNPTNGNVNQMNVYGQHSAGMAKFNEMFPGVMQGGDLGFDPMAIAIQMNPANQQRAAMDTMQKMMMGNGGNKVNPSLLQPVINATNAALTNLTQPPDNQAPNQQNKLPSTAQQPGGNVGPGEAQNQQVYTALTGAPTINQQHLPQGQVPSQQYQVPQGQVPSQQYQGQYQQQQQQMVDPNTGAGMSGTLPTVYENSEDLKASPEGSPPSTNQMVKEPILPADTSRNMPPANMNAKFEKSYHYNTLGQPVEMLPADPYRFQEPSLPQTLSPQPTTRSDPGRYSNVKSTVSKTSLMGNRPVGKTPSKSQLQRIYNQYKGSHSYTQQNIKPPDNANSHSDGHLNISKANNNRQAPIEKVGGDSAANNNMSASDNAAGLKPGQVGDIPVSNKPPADTEKTPANHSKVRNGLQDQTFTTYASAAWSFHGATPAPYIPYAYRYRNKA
ncbi:hypothetical protein SFRURICE_000487 [Spodoptera frugiperda]|uniref:SFRICE_014546 n=1 Tax=Spodoptera frugiperda TaxID=7108 RepID=A0A2H1WKI9_SPOFR|nr:hypothetical protein SFRURICE_000487 [Spodoptera frugiperda]